MNEGLIATRYAKSLLISLGSDSERAKNYYLAAGKILPVLEDVSAQLSALFSNVLLGMEKKEHALAAVFGRFAPILEQYARFMVRKGRGGYITHSLRIFMDLYRQAHGIVKVDVVTAIPLEQVQLEKLKEYLRRIYVSDLEVSMREDVALIAGFQLYVGDNLLDRSVAGELKAIKAGLGD